MDIEKQIEYWKEGAISDLEAASILLNNNKFLNALFFCHLAIEKALKAHYVKIYSIVPPRTHNLGFLLDKTGITVSQEQDEFIGIIMEYQLEGRYPQYYPQIPSKELVLHYLSQTEKIVQWLKTKL